jgi:hypothetical protein
MNGNRIEARNRGYHHREQSTEREERQEGVKELMMGRWSRFVEDRSAPFSLSRYIHRRYDYFRATMKGRRYERGRGHADRLTWLEDRRVPLRQCFLYVYTL